MNKPDHIDQWAWDSIGTILSKYSTPMSHGSKNQSYFELKAKQTSKVEDLAQSLMSAKAAQREMDASWLELAVYETLRVGDFDADDALYVAKFIRNGGQK